MRMANGRAAEPAPTPTPATAAALATATRAAPASGTTFAVQSARSLHQYVHRKSTLRL